MKTTQSNRNISLHGGVVPILKKIKDFGIPQVIRDCLGKRKEQSRYGYDDVFISWVLTALCGGTRLDHITELKEELNNVIPGLKLPSHDTLGRVMKKLATETVSQESFVKKTSKIVLNDFDNNLNMNRMLVRVTKKVGALQEGYKYTLHIDATFIETNCAGANISNDKEKNGFHPMVCLIDRLPVYVCMRNGSTNARFYLKEALEQCLDIMAENNIIIDRVISDGAAYDRELTNMLHARGIKFNIHAPFNWTFKTMMRQIEESTNWEKVEIETGHNFRNCEITEIPYSMYGQKNIFRLIVAKVPNRNGRSLFESPEEKERRKFVDEKMKILSSKNRLKIENKTYRLGKWKQHKNYKYKLIISNDTELSPRELLVEYNKRGDAERQFDFMKNDFGWRLPPFMKMNQNTVFMIAASLANNIYRGLLKNFNVEFPELKLNMRIKKFTKLFVKVIYECIDETHHFLKARFDYQKIM